jgi:hypothetical protein
MGPTKEYIPLDPSRVFWKAQPTDETPAESRTRYTPLDQRGIFWHYDNPNPNPVHRPLIPIHLLGKENPGTVGPLPPPSAELVAYERQQQIDAVYDQALTDNASYDIAIEKEAHAMNDRLDRGYRARHKMGALASMSLNMLSVKEAIGAKTRIIGHALGRFASVLSRPYFAKAPAVPTGYEPRHAFTAPITEAEIAEAHTTIQDDTILSQEIAGLYTDSERELIRRAVLATRGVLVGSRE